MQKVTVPTASFVKPHCMLMAADATVLLINGRSLQALERPAILVQAQIASLSTLV